MKVHATTIRIAILQAMKYQSLIDLSRLGRNSQLSIEWRKIYSAMTEGQVIEITNDREFLPAMPVDERHITEINSSHVGKISPWPKTPIPAK